MKEAAKQGGLANRKAVTLLVGPKLAGESPRTGRYDPDQQDRADESGNPGSADQTLKLRSLTNLRSAFVIHRTLANLWTVFWLR